MDATIKAQWLTDLRSGEYVQGHGSLSRDSKHCCLGVLCDQAVKAGVTRVTSDQYTEVYYDNEESHLPFTVAQWAGLDFTNPEVTVDEETFTLAELNDGESEYDLNDEPVRTREPYTFAQIADLIETQL